MATKKATPKKSEVLYLHCRCESCTNWELTSTKVIDRYDDEVMQDKLVCKTCGLEIPIEITIPARQTGIHWSTKE